MKVPLLDLKRQYEQFGAELERRVVAVLRSCEYIGGHEVETLERKLENYLGIKHAIAVSSGTDALLVSLMALDVKPGDEVITSDFSFFASAGTIARLGARPVFCDIDPSTLNLDHSKVEALITEKTKALIPVHLYGQASAMKEIMAIAHRKKVAVIEDAAQSIGAEYEGKKVGSWGDLGCFSFFPSKNLGGIGDGGLVMTNNTELYEKVKKLRTHGAHPKYFHALIGGNFRLDPIQAAAVNLKLDYLDGWTKKRQENVKLYKTLLEEAKLYPDKISWPKVTSNYHVFNQFIVLSENRDALMAYLKENNVGCEIYYPRPFHRQECFSYLGYTPGSFPNSDRAAETSLALPVFPELTTEEIKYVVKIIQQFFNRG